MSPLKSLVSVLIIALTLSACGHAARPVETPRSSAVESSAEAVVASPPLDNAEPFRVEIPSSKLEEIQARVRAYRMPRLAENHDWRSGIDPAFVRALVEYWRDRFDWRAQERKINAFHHYRATIRGQRVHFVYERGSGTNPKPLVLLHGWPYSFYEFLPIVEKLAHPERFGGNADDAFDVVIPSLPGIAFSDPPSKLAGLRAMAGVIHELMTGTLKYERYVMQGGDHGDVVGLWLARDYPQDVLGLHENMLAVRDVNAAYGTGGIVGPSTPEERAFMVDEKQRFNEQSAYFLTHLTRGQTLGAALSDSPVGQALWIAEKFYYWTDKTTRPFESTYSFDDLLTNIMLYVATDSFATSLWPYMAFVALPEEAPNFPAGTQINVPIAFAVLPNDGLQPVPPRSLMERSRPNIVQWTTYPAGGHFPFREQPEVFVDDLRRFARQLVH